MSEDIGCTLTDEELIDQCKDWITRLAMSGGKDWCLEIPVNFNKDPDMLFCELIKRFEILKSSHE